MQLLSIEYNAHFEWPAARFEWGFNNHWGEIPHILHNDMSHINVQYNKVLVFIDNRLYLYVNHFWKEPILDNSQNDVFDADSRNFDDLEKQMRIIIRFPNWLGDLVMSMGFVDLLYRIFPNAIIDGICKKSLAPLLDFDKRLYKVWGIDTKKPIIQGKAVASEIEAEYDLAFVLPKSISSALQMRQIPAKKKIGYSSEFRSFLLTDFFRFAEKGHRVFEYVELGMKYFQKHKYDIDFENLISEISTGFDIDEDYLAKMSNETCSIENYFVMNIVSEATSRTLSVDFAEELISEILEIGDFNLVFTGLPKQRQYIDDIIESMPTKDRLFNIAGRTGLMELVQIIRGARLMVSVDSGPAHLANSLGVMTFDLSGPDDPIITAPFNSNLLRLFRSGIECSPCVKNTCPKGDNVCLSKISIDEIIDEITSFFNSKELAD